MGETSYPIVDVTGCPDAERCLRAAGIRTTTRLLQAAANPRGRKALAAKTGIDEKQILCWANKADRMRIKGIGDEFAELLQAAGVDTVKELRYRSPANLAKAMRAANEKHKLVRALPSDQAITRWIESAKTLPLKISYR